MLIPYLFGKNSKPLAIYLLLVLLVTSVSFSRWEYSDAEGELCFSVNTTSEATGSDSEAWYNVILATVPLNGTFWNDNLRAYHPDDEQNTYLFHYASNATNSFFMLPVIDNLAAGELDRYCIYSGSSNYNDIQAVAPYNSGFDTETHFNNLHIYNTTAYSASWSGTHVNLSAAGYLAVYDSNSIYADIFMIGKIKRIDSNLSSSSSIIGMQSGYLTPIATNGWGIGIRGNNSSHGWFVTNENISTVNNSYQIYHMAARRGGTTKYANIYTENRTLLASDTSSTSSTNFGNLEFTRLAYISNASAEYDWAMAAKYLDGVNDWKVYNLSYDYINTNISVLAPAWEAQLTTENGVVLRVQYLGTGFDYCNLSLNGINFKNYSSLAPNQITTDVLNTAYMKNGDNEINISCNLGGVESHRYWYFTRTSADAHELFENAFGIDIGALCDADAQIGLDACFEYYKLNTYYNFSAVACKGLNTSINYSCLGLTNRTKNNYTIFWSPSNWSYDSSENISHLGAIFYYSGAPIDGRIEIYDSNKFMYIPAQNKSRDCEIYYSSTTGGCSYWNGFTVNDRHVIVSDDSNNWFIAGTAGIVDYNKTYSQLVIPTSVLPVTENTGGELFTGGIYTRVNCQQRNNSFIINVVNTAQQLYSVTVLGNNSFSYALTSTTLAENISTYGVTGITVTANNDTLCEYNGDSLLFLPFNIPTINIAGAEILIWTVLLFATILSAVIPFAMFIVVIINDIYSLLNPTQIGLITVFAVMASLVNNVYTMDRGIKHIIIIVAIVAAYLSALSEYESELGLTFGTYINLMTQFRDLAASSNLWDFTYNLFGFIISLFILVVTLPAQSINLVYDLLYILSPTIFTVAQPFREILIAGFMIYFYLKAYEVISNKFRGV